MKTMWLFRSNLRITEYYHEFKDINVFKKNCHDFYLLQGIWYLENTELTKFVVWRLKPKDKHQPDIVMKVNGKPFKQLFVDSFDEVLKYNAPDIAFFRGGFPEYDKLVSENPDFFKTTLYLGASKRVTPKYGGKYTYILVENDNELKIPSSIPFYKTANPLIFNKTDYRKVFDIVWICNNSQMRMKGQEYFIKQIAKSKFLQGLKILHIGNEPEKLEKLIKKYGVNNILISGYKSRPHINIFLNSGKIGLLTSDEGDGCPRLITEILCTSTILVSRKRTRMLSYYSKNCFQYEDDKLEDTLKYVIYNYDKISKENMKKNNYEMKEICEKNLSLWLLK